MEGVVMLHKPVKIGEHYTHSKRGLCKALADLGPTYEGVALVRFGSEQDVVSIENLSNVISPAREESIGATPNT